MVVTCICIVSEWSSDNTVETVVDTSAPFEEDTDAGVLDLWWEPLFEGIFPSSLPPLGIFFSPH